MIVLTLYHDIFNDSGFQTSSFGMVKVYSKLALVFIFTLGFLRWDVCVFDNAENIIKLLTLRVVPVVPLVLSKKQKQNISTFLSYPVILK